jgi:serpin B
MRPITLATSAALMFAGLGACGTPYQERTVTEAGPELTELVQGHNRFAIDLYKQGIDGDDNLFFSPFSVSAALGMTYAGARSETATEMADVLGVNQEDLDYHLNFGALIRDLSGDKGRGYSLHIANRLYGHEGYTFVPEFERVTAEHYAAPMQRVDFTGNVSVIRDEINGWVSEQTQGFIPELLPDGFANNDTRLVLVNAMYFEAEWKHTFDKDSTRNQLFFGTAGDVIVPMMHNTETYPLAQVDGAIVIELPYEDDEVALVMVLPDEHDGLSIIEEGLTSDQLNSWIGSLSPSEAHLALPKFELQHELPLTEILQNLGMNLAFDPYAADFSGIANDDLYIQQTVHKAFIRVDEHGTKAAAATAVGVGVTSMPVVTEVVADHPFLFLIHDRLTGSVLFMGRVTDPASISIE